jgi:malonyl CoA-acyl carrier protein transacylase
MAAIQATEDRIAQYIQTLKLNDRVAIAVYNGSDAHVVSGELKAVEGLMIAAKRDGLRCTKLNVDQGMLIRLYFLRLRSCLSRLP